MNKNSQLRKQLNQKFESPAKTYSNSKWSQKSSDFKIRRTTYNNCFTTPLKKQNK